MSYFRDVQKKKKLNQSDPLYEEQKKYKKIF